MKTSRGVLLVAVALLAVAALRDFGRLGEALPWRQLYDFADFYCAGKALDDGADPYRYEPLHRCEHRVNLSAAYRQDPGHVVPAPLPPYDFPPFMLAARLRYPAARAIDTIAILFAVAAAIWALARCGIPLDLAALALVMPAGYVLLNAGQVVPFALVALAWCGAAVARKRDGVAGILGGLTMIEPHLGLPVCAAMLLWVPGSRLAIAGTGLALALVAVWTSGIAGIAEFLWRVLPAQAAAEIAHPYQYSLTYLLNTVGVPASAALIAGELSYVAMLVTGVWLARQGAVRLARPELLPFLPAACSVIGGPYVHMVDLAFAIPSALVLADVASGSARRLAVISLCLLAVPWIPVWITKKLLLATLLVLFLLLWRLRAGAVVFVATLLGIGGAIYLFELAPPAPLVATTRGAFPPSDLAQAAWAAYVQQLPHSSLAWLGVKVPTWGGLAALVVACLAAPRTRCIRKPRKPSLAVPAFSDAD